MTAVRHQGDVLREYIYQICKITGQGRDDLRGLKDKWLLRQWQP